jgi:alkylation response protein AidB-like acyl-CoA dehydrogenase
MDYLPCTDDMHFVLSNVLHSADALQALPQFAEVDADLMQQVLDEAGKFVGEVIAPLNRDGDEIGAVWRAGQVTMPPGFKEAYRQFWQAGWPALSARPEDGGQGLPAVLEAMLYEMLSAANHGWTMAPGILHGAYECIKHHASEEVKGLYLEKVATGEWLSTMCLTEPHAGSDLGLVRTKAMPLVDGRYAVTGSKIFISSGDHDLTDNIVHLVLARLPDAPPGPKGLSLFLIPKFDSKGVRLPVHCDRIEEKMGLHGSPTCAMRFEEAPGWMVGEPGKGLAAMFLMMNSARLHVALQGIGLLDAALQKAHAYAQERRQMRAPGVARSGHEADVIAEHPAIQRILDTQWAWVAAGRWLAYRTGIELDRAKFAPQANDAHAAQQWCALATPVLKSIFTQQAFEGGSQCLQVLGGHGYVREWGIEQHVRDARVTMIYEGTNEIQAIDLLQRKVLIDSGQALRQWMSRELDALPQQGHDSLQQKAQIWWALTERIAKVNGHPRLSFELADDYLRGLGLWMLELAWSHLNAKLHELPDQSRARWQSAARALQRWVMPEWDMRVNIMVDALDAIEVSEAA